MKYSLLQLFTDNTIELLGCFGNEDQGMCLYVLVEKSLLQFLFAYKS